MGLYERNPERRFLFISRRVKLRFDIFENHGKLAAEKLASDIEKSESVSPPKLIMVVDQHFGNTRIKEKTPCISRIANKANAIWLMLVRMKPVLPDATSSNFPAR